MDSALANETVLWGEPSILWSAATLAILTLPVVIVSVEESLRNVPQNIREGSLALGATKLQTIRNVILPNARTGIFTGSILAVSRGAGEVAPILFTGAVYSLSTLPTSLSDPFMELGYHIFILSTQSPNVEQTLPLQYATTLVLLGLTFLLNFTAIYIRSQIRKNYVS
jgi:phosphate transport system permease protein